ncbi:hypothetical protein ACHAWF_004923 [Thalassiosira exigua]
MSSNSNEDKSYRAFLDVLGSPSPADPATSGAGGASGAGSGAASLPRSALPAIVRATLAVDPDRPSRSTSEEEKNQGSIPPLGLRIKRGDEHEGSVVVYYAEPGGPAAGAAQDASPGADARGTSDGDSDSDVGSGGAGTQSNSGGGLRAGDEILAVGVHSTKGSLSRTAEMLGFYAERMGTVDVLASRGPRPHGSLYLLVKIDGVKPETFEERSLSMAGEAVAGLEVEESRVGNERRVRVATVTAPATGPFAGHRLNKGDWIQSVDGVGVRRVDDLRRALGDASRSGKKAVPVLVHNVFRKLKTAVMATAMLAGTAKNWDDGQTRKVAVHEEYDVHEKLGEGAFAVVKRATHKVSKETYAIKIINRSSLNKDAEDALKDEISILKALDHDNIVRLTRVFFTIGNYYLVQEYLEGGELFDRIVEKSSYTEAEARDVCKVLFSALSYMNARGIAHRDLKPENLLLRYKHSDSEIKIADFGFATEAPDDHSLSTMCGTPGYVAPEILRKERYGTKCDMWSMGIIVFIMLGGYPPFYADSPRELLRQTKRGKFTFDEEYWGEISCEAKDMISSLIVTDPFKRASADDILSNSDRQVVSKTLNFTAGHAFRWMNQDKNVLMASSLIKSQGQLKKYIARQRLKKAMHAVLFVNIANNISANGIFSGRTKQASIHVLKKNVV